MMKCFVVIAVLALFAQSQATELDVCNQIAQRVLQTLKNESSNLTVFNFLDSSTSLSPVLNVTLNSIEHELAVDNQSIKCESKSTGLLNVTFDIFIADFSLDGDLSVFGYNRPSRTAAHIRSVAMGNVTLSTQAFFTKKSRTLVVKNVPANNVEYINDYDWADTTPGFKTIRDSSESWVDLMMSSQLPDALNFRVHKLIYDNTFNITNGLNYYY